MFDEFMKLVDACGNDVMLDDEGDGDYSLTFDDFEGFDDDWKEVDRQYDNYTAVWALQHWLDDNCDKCDDDYYATYYFKGFSVTVGFTSMDI